MELTTIVKGLAIEKTRLESELRKVTNALSALNGLSGRQTTGKRRMSASARARIAATQRARWAKWKAKK